MELIFKILYNNNGSYFCDIFLNNVLIYAYKFEDDLDLSETLRMYFYLKKMK